MNEELQRLSDQLSKPLPDYTPANVLLLISAMGLQSYLPAFGSHA